MTIIEMIKNLAQRNSVVASADVLAVIAELEIKDKRIAELEAIATEYAGKFQKAQDAAKHLVIMNDSAQAEIAHLKTLLATPVRLPLPEQQDITCVLLDKRKVAAAIHAAGFKVEGDE
nr:hypothetical protein [uncultured Serratia sp.]